MKTESWLQKHITLHDYDDPKAERANALTHGFGAILAVLALGMVIGRFSFYSSGSLARGMVLFCLTMILLYSSSTLYHLAPKSDAKRILRVFDHSSIYVLIAGTYTPLMLGIDSDTARMVLFLVWTIAVAGIILTFLFWGKFKVLRVLLYVVMGWLVVFFWGDIIPFLPQGLFPYVLAGGITYTVGVAFYASKRLPCHHAVWHLFCIGGSVPFFIGFFVKLR
ncbi:MAG: hemolysin-III related [Spirochaetes bacterium ADurb.Bin315]|nr:DNA-binding protein [Spirochaetales bacterium]OQA42060.1 MAG: hemolysin-III related [Spirochaetes bacterium ADurb.Bin315]HNZ95538.1 hemolysin III family protein [Sphaerochaeta sp.]HOE89596.1 hemolysin III family protein [Sphaerochaeta sp.]HPY45740.1 hemolysin III family protein [Sphaerochaeta sp.]